VRAEGGRHVRHEVAFSRSTAWCVEPSALDRGPNLLEELSAGALVMRTDRTAEGLREQAAHAGSSLVTLAPRGNVMRTGGVGAPTRGGSTKSARKSKSRPHFLGCFALAELPGLPDRRARRPGRPQRPRSVTSHALSSSPIIDLTG